MPAYPKLVTDLLASLASKDAPVPRADLPTDSAVVRIAQRNRLVQAVVWSTGSPGHAEPGRFIIVGQAAGWVSPSENDSRPLHLSITQTGRDVLDEARLAELAAPQAVRTPKTKQPKTPERRARLAQELTPRHEAALAYREGAPCYSFQQIADRLGITKQAAHKLYRQAVAIRKARGSSVQARLSYREAPDRA